MAQPIQSEHLEALEGRGGELFDLATLVAAEYAQLPEGATPEQQDVAIKVQALVLAINGLLSASKVNEGMVMMGVGAAAGVALAKCVSDRRPLYHAFKVSMDTSFNEVVQAERPVGTA